MTSETKRHVRRAILIAFWAGILAWGVSYPDQFLALLLMAVGSAIAMAFVLTLGSLIFLLLEDMTK